MRLQTYADAQQLVRTAIYADAAQYAFHDEVFTIKLMSSHHSGLGYFRVTAVIDPLLD